ncbi:hypothetical protein ACEPPN_012715 [Leptodophora sp. 'Broadleaf-Isolate-01']
MDPVSSSPTLGVEFGLLPRTPASNRSKNGRAPNGKENSQSGGSLHRRLFDAFRSRSRSRSLTRASEDGSPSTKPVKRRKSIVDLLYLSSREPHHENDANVQEHLTKTEANMDKENYAKLFSDMPKRRRSLGNLLNPTNILGTITNRVPQKSSPVLRESPVKHGRSTIESPDKSEHAESESCCDKQTDHAHNTTDKNQNKTGSPYVKLAEGSVVDIDLFESRLDRLLDGIITERYEGDRDFGSNDSYLKLLQEACEKVEDEYRSCSPDSMRPLLSHPRNETKNTVRACTPDITALFSGESRVASEEEKRPKTPDSYLRLLIASAGGPTKDDQSPSPNSSVQFSETSSISCSASMKGRSIDIQSLARCGSAKPSSGLTSLQSGLRNYQYQVRDTTPDPYVDKELAWQTVHDRRPSVTFREISRSSTLIDLDPEFCQRQEERSERYEGLGLTATSHWKSSQEQIAQSIASTVARMTRNYHFSSDETIACSPATETDQYEDEAGFNLRCCGGFEVDENETWDSVIVGQRLLLQGETDGRQENLASKDLTPILTPIDEASLLNFDGLSTIPRSSASVTDHLVRLSAEDIFLPSVEEVLQDSAALRSPLEPFFANRSAKKKDVPVELDKEIDFCPDYESFLRRSYGTLNPTPSDLLQLKEQPEARLLGSGGAQMLPPRVAKSRQISFSAVQVRYPGTVNLLQHTEYFSSIEDAMLGLCNYKLGDLANFFVYDAEHCIIDAQLIDSPVPNPAELKKKGLQLGWIPQSSNIAATETVGGNSRINESPCHSTRRPSLCDSGWEEFALETVSLSDEPGHAQFALEKASSSSLRLSAHATSERAISATNSVFDDDFFLDNESGGQFSERASVSGDSSAIRALRAAISNEEIVSVLNFEDEMRATKTWVQLAVEMRANYSPRDGSTDEDVSEDPWRLSMPPFDESKLWPNKQQTGSSLDRKIDEGDGLYNSLDTPSNPKPCSENVIEECCRSVSVHPASSNESRDEMENTGTENSQSYADSHQSNFYQAFDVPAVPTAPHLDSANISLNQLDLTAQVDTMNRQREVLATPEPVIDHSAGYHFTAVKDHMMGGSEALERSSAVASGNASAVLYDAAHHLDIDIDSDYSLYDEDAVSSSDEIQATTEDNCADPVQKDGSHAVDASNRGCLGEFNPNSLKHPVLDFTTTRAISCSVAKDAAKDVERADYKDAGITLPDLDLRLVGKAARPSPPTKNGKSKVGALVNIFQDYGLMPEQSRGPLQVSSVSPSFSRQTSRYRVQSSGTSVGSSTVRRISATLSTGSLSVPSPINRVGTPCSTFDRPHSRISDIDTEASFQFGEVLKRSRKHGESESEDPSLGETEMYG